jgi:hypothetical protein
MSQKKKLPKVATPEGVAAYAWVNKPDSGNEYSDDKYKVTLLLDEEAESTENFVAKITAQAKELAAEEWGKCPKDLQLPFRDGNEIADEKEDKEDFRGMVVFTLKSKYQPGVVDAKKKSLPAKAVMSGDLIRASALLVPYKTTETVVENGKKKKATVHGVTFRLRNIQLLEKRNMGGGAAGDFDEMDEYESVADSYQEGGDEDVDNTNEGGAGDQEDYDDI